MQFLNDLAFIMNDLLSTCSIGQNFKLFIDRVTLVFAQKTKKNGNKVTLRNVTNKNIENMTSFFLNYELDILAQNCSFLNTQYIENLKS